MQNLLIAIRMASHTAPLNDLVVSVAQDFLNAIDMA